MSEQLPAINENSQEVNTEQHAEPTKYDNLLNLIEKMKEDIKPTYAGSKACADRLKKNIALARIMIRENLTEVNRDKQKWNIENLQRSKE